MAVDYQYKPWTSMDNIVSRAILSRLLTPGVLHARLQSHSRKYWGIMTAIHYFCFFDSISDLRQLVVTLPLRFSAALSHYFAERIHLFHALPLLPPCAPRACVLPLLVCFWKFARYCWGLLGRIGNFCLRNLLFEAFCIDAGWASAFCSIFAGLNSGVVTTHNSSLWKGTSIYQG